MKFTDLGLNEPILRAISAAGYELPTPIQAMAIPHVLAGKDVLGCAQTGTGKTAAFALPLAQRLMAKHDAAAAAKAAPNRPEHDRQPGHGARSSHGGGGGGGGSSARRPIRALILSPTRELTLQIAENLAIYAKNSHLRHVVIFGGVGQHPQVRALREGVDIVVATPGRLMDLMQQGYVDLRHVQIFVLDEADRMLDMGFIEPIRHIAAAVPKQRQTLLFSATMPKEIRRLADSLLTDPVSIEVSPSSTLPVKIEHSVFHVHRGDKPNLLTTVLKTTEVSRALVFTRTKHGADKVAERLGRDGIIAEAIHGNKRQNVRQRTLANFKSGKTPVLVATDIAARGIDVDDVSHVINYELPHEPETYVHRIGRTGRAGNTGIAVSFCDHDERSFLRAIERLVKRPIEVVATPVLAKPVHEPRGQRPERPETAYHERSYPPRRPSHPTSSTGHRVSRPPAPRTGPGGGGGGEGHGGPPRGANRPHSGKPQGGGRPAGPRGQASGSGKPAASGQGQPASPGKGAGRRGQPGTGFRGNTRSGPPRA